MGMWVWASDVVRELLKAALPLTSTRATRLFCDVYNPQSKTYCKRLQVLCPEHSRDPKVRLPFNPPHPAPPHPASCLTSICSFLSPSLLFSHQLPLPLFPVNHLRFLPFCLLLFTLLQFSVPPLSSWPPSLVSLQVPADEVCGCPLVRDVFELTGDFCRLPKRQCNRHYCWEKLRRAEVDLERVRVVGLNPGCDRAAWAPGAASHASFHLLGSGTSWTSCLSRNEMFAQP